MMTERELLKLKDRIEQADKDAARFEGQKASILDNLEQMGYKTVEAAEKGLKELEEEIEDKEEALEKAVREVEKHYETIEV